MPPLPTRPLVLARTVALLAVLASVAGCRGDDGTVTISGDVPGLDTLGFKGDSLFARAEAPLRTMDSLRAEAAARAVGAPSPAVTRKAGPGANSMTVRAQSRGDSMARAAALRLADKTASGRSRGDTVRGVVTLVGTEPARQVVLRADNGATTISLSGMATTGLSKLAGAELMVRGVKITPRDVVVADYVVRAMNGVPTLDGRLEGDADGWWLELSDGSGRKRLASPPTPLRELEGARVWIAVGSGASPTRTYGVIGRR